MKNTERISEYNHIKFDKFITSEFYEEIKTNQLLNKYDKPTLDITKMRWTVIS